MDLIELLMKRRSVRNFEDRPVPAEVIDRLLDAANNAPSGGNILPRNRVSPSRGPCGQSASRKRNDERSTMVSLANCGRSFSKRFSARENRSLTLPRRCG